MIYKPLTPRFDPNNLNSNNSEFYEDSDLLFYQTKTRDYYIFTNSNNRHIYVDAYNDVCIGYTTKRLLRYSSEFKPLHIHPRPIRIAALNEIILRGQTEY